MPRKTVNPKAIIAVDPGLNGTGVAFAVMHPLDPKVYQLKWKVVRIPPKLTAVINESEPHSQLHSRCRYVATEVGLLADVWFSELMPGMRGAALCLDVVLETQQVWTQSVHSMAAAGRGDIVKLSHLTGTIAHQLHTLFHSVCRGVYLYPPNDWKGNLDKDQLKRRVVRRLEPTFPQITECPDHATDAVGLILAHRRQL